MYNNIGKKIKGLATAVCIIGAIISVLVAIDLWIEDEMAGEALVTIVVGPLMSWVSSWVLYGFGELVDRVGEIADNTSPIPPSMRNSLSAKTEDFTTAFKAGEIMDIPKREERKANNDT